METYDGISVVLSIILTNEIVIETVSQTYIFLNTILKQYNTTKGWYDSSAHIYSLAEQFQIGAVRLPYMDLTTRPRAKKEMKKWSYIFYELTNERPHISKRIQNLMNVPYSI